MARYDRESKLYIPDFIKSRGVCICAILLTLLSVSCGKSAAVKEKESKILLQIGDSILYERDVLAQIPAGISSADSTLLYDAVVEDWLEKRLLIDIAELNLPTVERIERMVDEYRMQLLVNEYRRVMAESGVSAVSEDSIEKYYELHKDELTLQQPLLKGIYVKIDALSPRLDEVRGWVKNDDANDIAELERYGLRGAVQYDDFRNTWVSWQSLSEIIPYRFRDDSERPGAGDMFDKRIGGFVYLLNVTEVLEKGEPMPFEFARKEISRILADRMRASYDDNLLLSLYKNALETKRIQIGGYVPAKYR